MKDFRAENVVQEVGHLPSKPKTLNSNPSTRGKKKKKNDFEVIYTIYKLQPC
jgi:hypothetical protein